MTARTPRWQRIVAGCGLLACSPLLGAAAVAIKTSNPGPVFHRATRAGVGGHPFTMYKLRTMQVHTDTQGSITALEDSRIFPVGRWLRKLKLDELPQLINVVTGEMALVGPRPEAFDIVRDHYADWMMETLAVPPGITGPGSLHFIEQERELPTEPDRALHVYVTSLLPQKLAFELTYVRSRSLHNEFNLIVRTVIGVICRGEPDPKTASHEAQEARRILDEVSAGGRLA